MQSVRITFYFLFFIGCSHSYATEPFKVNIRTADSIFLANNYYLLAASMNIDAQKAQVIQASLYPNPIFTADFNAYNPEDKRAFDIGQQGQKAFQFEQLILLGGKRRAEIDLAKTNATIAELEFKNLVRQLRFRLHSDLFAIGQQKFLLDKYNKQLALLDTLLSAYQIQTQLGNIALKDIVRLKGAYLKLNNDRAELFKPYYEAQANLQKLLQTTAEIEFQFTEEQIVTYIKSVPLEELQFDAIKNRPDFLTQGQNQLLAKQYLQYQKKLAVPDINLFTSYDQRSGAYSNQINVGLAIALPLWNRNQGNIKTSQFRLKEAEYNLKALENEIMSDLNNNYLFYSQTVSEYKKAALLYNQDFETTIQGMTSNFQKRNVSIIEFIDFFESYNEVLTEMVRIKIQLVSSAETLNLLIGKDIY